MKRVIFSVMLIFAMLLVASPSIALHKYESRPDGLGPMIILEKIDCTDGSYAELRNSEDRNHGVAIFHTKEKESDKVFYMLMSRGHPMLYFSILYSGEINKPKKTTSRKWLDELKSANPQFYILADTGKSSKMNQSKCWTQ